MNNEKTGSRWTIKILSLRYETLMEKINRQHGLNFDQIKFQ